MFLLKGHLVPNDTCFIMKSVFSGAKFYSRQYKVSWTYQYLIWANQRSTTIEKRNSTAPLFGQGDLLHYNDVIMGAIASQITSLTIVYSTIYSDTDQRKHQGSALLAFVWGIHRGPVNSPHKWPVTQKYFHLMTSSYAYFRCRTTRIYGMRCALS